MSKTDVSHMQLKTNKFHGIYRGVIEDNTDPEKLGRCKVRVWGVHDEVKIVSPTEGIPTDHLPWAEPCLGLIEGSVSGHGLFSVPLQGSHVFLFFEAGNWEAPRFFATAPGLPIDAPDPTVGFNDPDAEFPREDRLNESDYHRLARGVTGETIVEHKDDNLDEGVVIVDGATWDEPPSAYAAVYPKNIVLTTHRGITVELDNTTDNERIHIFHPSNTYIEIDVDGNVVFRNEGNRFEITRKTKRTHVQADDHETIEFDKTSRVGNNETIEIGSTQDEDIGIDRKTVIGNNDSETVGANQTVDIGSNQTISVGSNLKIDVGGNIDITAGGNITINGATINLN
jgi:hypothetical protein